MSLLRRMAEIMSARTALRRSAAVALSSGSRAIATGGEGRAAASSSPSRHPSSAWPSPPPTTSTRYYSPYASAAASEAAASAAATAAATPAPSSPLRRAPPPPGQTPQNAPLPPWTPTRLLAKRKRPQKRMRALIQHLEREHVERAAAQKTQLLAGGAAGATAGAAGGTAAATAAFPSSKRALPRAGDVLEVKTIVPEAGRKVYTYKGVCLGRASKGPRSWIKMYNVFPDAGGVVQHLPIYMPDLLSIKVIGRLPRARRARLYHLLEDESSTQTYQATVPQPTAAPATGA